MRTKFGKSLIATGLIAALGANLALTSPAFAGPGRDRDGDNDRRYSRGNDRDNGAQRRDGRRWNNNRPDGDRGARRGGPAPQQSGPRNLTRRDRGPSHGSRQTVQWRTPTKAEPNHRTVRVMQKPTVTHNTVVVKQAPVVHKHVEQKTVVKVGRDYGRDHGRNDYYRSQHIHYGAPTRVIVVPERRRYRNIWVVRNYGHRYHGYGHYHHDDDAYKWLAFTAITVALINNLSVQQQRAYEDAQIRATTAPIGETIQWQEAGAYGSVTTTRDGTSSLNRYCREFQKTVTIGGQTEQAYGTACMQPDGAWEVVSDNNY